MIGCIDAADSAALEILDGHARAPDPRKPVFRRAPASLSFSLLWSGTGKLISLFRPHVPHQQIVSSELNAMDLCTKWRAAGAILSVISD